MKHENRDLRFFLGANAPSGFVSHFDGLYNPEDGWRCYIIKGGPGTGKSGLMKQIIGHTSELNHEIIHCSSDPDSLDGVIFPDKKMCIADGTAPHVIEPKYPGAVEIIVNLGDYWNQAGIAAHTQDIIKYTQLCSVLHQRSARLRAAAGTHIADNSRHCFDCVNYEKLQQYTKNVAAKEFSYGSGTGSDRLRYLTGITPKKIVGFWENIENNYEKIYIIEDEFGVVSKKFMSEIRNACHVKKLDIITCLCPMSVEDKVDHILIPSLSLAFVTRNSWHNVPFKGTKTIHARRFTDEDVLRQNRQRFGFNRKASRELMKEAIALLAEAKAAHDVLESFYTPYMDFVAIQKRADALAKEILAAD